MDVGGGEAAQTRRSYDAVAQAYAEGIGDELAGKALDRALLDALRELAAGGLILDIGCGPGHVAAYLGGRACGLDLSTAMCALGRDATGLPFAAADMTALPVRSGMAAAVVCLYAAIHLDGAARAASYAELARVLAPGGHALISFHTSDAQTPMGGAMVRDEFLGSAVALTFRFLDPDVETALLAAAGLALVARVDREPVPLVEHPSRRSYLLVRRD